MRKGLEWFSGVGRLEEDGVAVNLVDGLRFE